MQNPPLQDHGGRGPQLSLEVQDTPQGSTAHLQRMGLEGPDPAQASKERKSKAT